MSASVDVAICNSALSKIGANRIISLEDDSVEGRACREQYPKIKRALLRSHPWNFATKRSQLAVSATAPVFEFTYSFPIPEDCVRVLNVESEESFPWKIEGRNIVTDNNSCYVKYISAVDEGIFDETFKEALACALGVDLAMPLTQSASTKASVKLDYKEALRDARTYDAQESVGDRVYADGWLNERS